VFIAGCEDGLIPYTLFKNQETDRDEEKRLLYVGMTRAQSYLYMTHASKRFIIGQERTMQRSPFLNRIEKELMEVDKNTYKKKKQDDSQLKLF
jgi:superfamily I DNA/RNA helicase